MPLSPNASDNKYTYGTTVYVTASPVANWRFDHFKNSASDDVYYENPFRVIMTGNISLIAVFVEDDGLDPAENIGATGSPVRGANGYIAAPRGITALKYFQEDAPRYQIIAAGSTIG